MRIHNSANPSDRLHTIQWVAKKGSDRRTADKNFIILLKGQKFHYITEGRRWEANSREISGTSRRTADEISLYYWRQTRRGKFNGNLRDFSTAEEISGPTVCNFLCIFFDDVGFLCDRKIQDALSWILTS